MTPPRRAFLTAEWRYLVMLNYEVDAAILRPLVPRGTELDLWEGCALASVVGFRFLRTRLLGVPVPFHRDFNEPYLALPMRSSAPASASDAPGRIAYEWQMRSRWESVSATAAGAASIPSPASEAAFITEHYWGYTRQRDGGTVEYEVAHPPWRVWEARAPALVADLPALYGAAFAAPLALPPRSSYIAEGSEVSVFRPLKIT